MPASPDTPPLPNSLTELLAELLALDRRCEATWQALSDTLEHHLAADRLDAALALARAMPPDDAALACRDHKFLLWAAVAEATAGDTAAALAHVQNAYRHGYRAFWDFAARRVPQDDSSALQRPLHANAEVQAWVDSVFDGTVGDWGMDPRRTPFCWFEQGELTVAKARCAISDKLLHKGAPVYRFRFFNGSFDIPTEFGVADTAAFDSDPAATANRLNYQGRSCLLEAHAFKVGYAHPRVHAFWRTLDGFDLDATLALIAEPPLHELHRGTGGEFVNLLHALVQCGHLDAIVQRLPALPAHMALLLMCFDAPDIRSRAAAHLGLPELPALFELALTPYARKSPADVCRLIDFGARHPRFRQLLATVLVRYELHVYDNYNPGVNWFFQAFAGFALARGGGLLDFLVAEPELLPVLHRMKTQSVCDDHGNDLPALHRTLVLNLAWSDDPGLADWRAVPATMPHRTRLAASHRKTEGVIASAAFRALARDRIAAEAP